MGVISDFIADARIDYLFQDLYAYGWFHYVFPFLLVYAVVLTILNRVEVFKKNKAVRIIVAFVFALFAIAFPISEGPCYSGGGGYTVTGGGCTIGDLMLSLFPGVTAFTIGILALYIVAAMLGVDLMDFLGKDESQKRIMRYILGGIGLIFVVYYFGLGFGWWDGQYGDFWLWDLLRDPLLYIILVFGLLFFWISGSDDGPDGTAEGNPITINQGGNNNNQ